MPCALPENAPFGEIKRSGCEVGNDRDNRKLQESARICGPVAVVKRTILHHDADYSQVFPTVRHHGRTLPSLNGPDVGSQGRVSRVLRNL